MMEDAVLAGAADVGAAGGQAAHHGAVGEAAVAGDDEVAAGRHFVPQGGDPVEGDTVEVLLLERLAVGFVIVGGGGRGRFGGARGVDEIDGHHAGRAVPEGPGGGDLEVALGVDEVGLEGGTERVTLPAAAVDGLAGLAHDGVVEADDQWRARGQMLEHGVAGVAEEHALVNAVPGVEPVVGGPVLVLATAGADEVGYGGRGRTQQQGEHVLVKPQGAGGSGGGGGGGCRELFGEPFAQEGREVFF
jgi:hypothetical protein